MYSRGQRIQICHGNQMFAKISQIPLILVLCKKSRNFSHRIVEFSGDADWSMISEFSREQRELPWQPNLDKKCQNCTYFSYVQEMETFFARTIGFSGMANLNMLSNFFIEQMVLPRQCTNKSHTEEWHKNLHKMKVTNKTNCTNVQHNSSFCKGASGVLHTTGSNTMIFAVSKACLMSSLHCVLNW